MTRVTGIGFELMGGSRLVRFRTTFSAPYWMADHPGERTTFAVAMWRQMAVDAGLEPQGQPEYTYTYDVDSIMIAASGEVEPTTQTIVNSILPPDNAWTFDLPAVMLDGQEVQWHYDNEPLVPELPMLQDAQGSFTGFFDQPFETVVRTLFGIPEAAYEDFDDGWEYGNDAAHSENYGDKKL
jgi:hypothetical protein